MGSILSFRPIPSDERRETMPPGAPAAVVIFPGVRYERIAQDEDARCFASSGSIAPGKKPRRPVPAR